jgi:hypothetical protein
LAGPPENAPNTPILTDVYQSALYSDCLMATDANALKAVKKPNAFTDAKTLSSDMAKAGPSLPALQALTPVQIGCVTSQTLRDYAKQLSPTGKTNSLLALTNFLNQGSSGCLTIASGYTPLSAAKIAATCSLTP